MKQFLFFLAFALFFIQVNAQRKKHDDKPKYIPTDQEVKAMLDSIPSKDGKIFYDEIVFSDSSYKKDELFIKIRQWFVENFMDSKNVLEVNDMNNGLLTGKGTYKYAKLAGLAVHEGYTMFVMNVAVKDGKFRYQLYNFQGNGTSSSLFGATQYSSGVYAENIDLDKMYQMYKEGKRTNYTGKYLEDVVKLVYYVQHSLKDLAVQKSSISDF